MTDDEKTLILADIAKGIDEGFELDSLSKMIVKRHDGTYRNAIPTNETSYFLTGIRIAKKHPLVFEFEPEDANEAYVSVEVGLKDVDDVFPLLLESMIDLVNAGCFGISVRGDHTDTAAFFEEVWVALADLKSKSVMTDEEEMKKNPIFGMF